MRRGSRAGIMPACPTMRADHVTKVHVDSLMSSAIPSPHSPRLSERVRPLLTKIAWQRRDPNAGS